MQGHNTMRSKLSIRVFVNDKQAYNFNFYILQDLAQIQVQIAGQIDVLYRNLFFVALVILSSWEFKASLVQSERSKR